MNEAEQLSTHTYEGFLDILAQRGFSVVRTEDRLTAPEALMAVGWNNKVRNFTLGEERLRAKLFRLAIPPRVDQVGAPLDLTREERDEAASVLAAHFESSSRPVPEALRAFLAGAPPEDDGKGNE